MKIRTLAEIAAHPLPGMEDDPVYINAVGDATHAGMKIIAFTSFGMDRICGCGTCKEAMEAAMREYVKLRESGHCGHWIVQIASMLLLAEATEGMLRQGVSPQDLQVCSDTNTLPASMTPAHAEAITVAHALNRQTNSDIQATMMGEFASREDSGVTEMIDKLVAMRERITKARNGN